MTGVSGMSDNRIVSRSPRRRRSVPRQLALRVSAGLLLASGLLAGCARDAAAQTDGAPQLGKAPVADVIAALTLEEKVALVTGRGMNSPGVQLDEDKQAPVVGQTDEKVPGAAGTTFPIPRLGIPSLVLADGPAGLRITPVREGVEGRTFHATAFPIATQLASSWDVALVESVGKAIGSEVKEYGVDVLLAPALNLHRYPLGGRNFEYYSEDPLLSGRMAAAAVRGVQSQGVGTSIKHYAVNNHEWNRNTIDVKVDERALREIYLKGFEIAVRESRPWTVMSSYNKLNGSYTSENGWLLTDVLRKQWGYDGVVMTDWFGGRDAVAQMQAGNELLMPGTGKQQQVLLEAVRTGKLDEKVLDRNIEKILGLVLRSPAFHGYRHSDKPDLAGNARIARAAAAEGMVLLKNEAAALPLRAAAKLALFGNSAYEMVTGGTGSGDVNEAYSIPLPQGLADTGFGTDAVLAKAYTTHIAAEKAKRKPSPWFLPPPPLPERLPDAGEIGAAAAANDIALVTIGRNSGEFNDRKAEDDFYLSQAERQLLAAVSNAFHARGKKVVAVLNVGGVIETASWRDQVDAIVLAWQPGQEAGHAIADVLSGKVNPSGKLADTFALKLEDYPAAANFPGVVLQGPDPNDKSPFGSFARAAEVEYRDGIWVGYRHFDTRGVDVAYPFGYGLSYTSFAYSGLKLSAERFGDELTATVTVTNTGKVAGKEAVQLYVAAPQGALPKPEAELRAFAKTGLLQPGQSQTLSFRLTARDLASFDPAAKTWVAAAGRYTLKIGASSRDIRQSMAFVKPEASQLPL